MSVRIYELSKKIDMENKELVQLLQDRGYQVKSASSTIDPITAEALIEELKPKAGAKPEAVTAPPATTPAPAQDAPGPKLPAGVFVKSKADLDREKAEKEAAEKEALDQQLEQKRQERESVRQAVTKRPGTPAQPPQLSAPARKAPPGLPPMGAALTRPPKPAPAPGPAAVGAPGPQIPKGALVKSKADLDREKAEKEAAQKAALAPKPAQAPAQPKPKAEPASTPAQPKAAPAIPPVAKMPPATPPVPARHTPAEPPAEPKATEVVAQPPAAPALPKPVPGVATPPPAQQPKASSAPALPDGARLEEKDGQKILHLKPPIVVRDFAQMLGLKPFQLNAELMELGIFAGINSSIEAEVAIKLASRHGLQLEVHHRGEEKQPQVAKKTEAKVDEDDPALLEPRPPVVCIMGHVDHGKTTLLDTIRKTKVVDAEAGGITQHTAAYQVIHKDHKISFIDTPGHAAFSSMRQRGADITDIAILVIAADDGFMPQTLEALKCCQKAGVPVVVAINKMDAKGANLDRVHQQMQQHGIAPEEWGGETLCQPISALKGEHIDELLEQVLLQAEIMELKANPKANPLGVILETQIEVGRGCTTTVIMQKGTLKVGQALVCGSSYCKVRSLLNDAGKPIKSIGPGETARVLGWAGTPSTGIAFYGVKNEKEARREAEENEDALKKAEEEVVAEVLPDTVDELLAAIDAQQKKTFRMVLKSDVLGTVEALEQAFRDVKSDKVGLHVISSGVGQVTKNDVILASSSEANIVCFNVKTENGVPALAKHHNVRIITHNIIYELINQVEEAMAELLEPERRESKMGAAEVRAVFPAGRGFVAGCMITEGKIKRDAIARIMREGEMLHQGRIGTLRRFKDDVTEVRAGYECGIGVTAFNDYQEGDTIEVFQVEHIRPSL